MPVLQIHATMPDYEVLEMELGLQACWVSAPPAELQPCPWCLLSDFLLPLAIWKNISGLDHLSESLNSTPTRWGLIVWDLIVFAFTLDGPGD